MGKVSHALQDLRSPRLPPQASALLSDAAQVGFNLVQPHLGGVTNGETGRSDEISSMEPWINHFSC